MSCRGEETELQLFEPQALSILSNGNSLLLDYKLFNDSDTCASVAAI